MTRVALLLLPALAIGAGILGSILVINNRSGDEQRRWDSAADAVNARDSETFITELGGDIADRELAERVKESLASVPPGLTVEIVSVKEGKSSGDVRMDEIQAQTSVPGRSTQLISINVVRVKEQNRWLIQAVLPAIP